MPIPTQAEQTARNIEQARRDFDAAYRSYVAVRNVKRSTSDPQQRTAYQSLIMLHLHTMQTCRNIVDGRSV